MHIIGRKKCIGPKQVGPPCFKSAWVLSAAAMVLVGSAARAGCARGAEAFAKCSSCHSMQPGQHLMGPSLALLSGRKAGSVEGFAFSAAMRGSDVVWNEQTLERFIEDPRGMIPGTAMPFRGLKDAAERQALVCYLLQQPQSR